MAEWILGREQGGCAWLGRDPGKRSERRSCPKAICPNGMRSFWKVTAFRLTESIRIQSGRRALRCFQNELNHFIILNLKGSVFRFQIESLYAPNPPCDVGCEWPRRRGRLTANLPNRLRSSGIRSGWRIRSAVCLTWLFPVVYFGLFR